MVDRGRRVRRRARVTADSSSASLSQYLVPDVERKRAHGLRRRPPDQPARARGSSTSRSWPRPTGSATCGRSTRTCCGRSRTSIYTPILAETRTVTVGPMVTNPATRDWTVTASRLRHAERDVRQPHGVRHRPRRLGGARDQREAVDDCATLRESIHVIRELANGRAGRVQGLDAAVPVGSTSSGSRCGWPRTDRKALQARPARSATGSSCSSPTPTSPRGRSATVRRGRRRRRAAIRRCSRSASPRPLYVGDDLRAHARPVPMVRRHGRQPRRRHRARATARPSDAVPTALTDYIAGREGYDYNEHGQAGNDHADVRARRDRRPLLHPRDRSTSTSRRLAGAAARSGVDQFAVYLQHDAKDATLQAYGERVLPTLAEHVAART